ncbi:DUF3592 domain-containing protein [Streptomyces sp. WM6378]|uniref:DUF3592 domain-containing protein n=1 Tax=Streptomyces sp. WM6378 TaxID=1415557 RepID=UPI0006AE121D|nr:DUF3592 domain-containing protein [Streptomyces sp. WM6378]KOU43583.1 hypothetical protein ADK54_17470 [Streptomyces sp. WM6378]
MELLVIGLIGLATFGLLCAVLVRQLADRLRSVFGGLVADGVCVRRYSSEGNTHWHHVYGFTTADGRYLEFEEDAAFMAQGQAVTVRYRPGRNPERTATVMGQGGAWSPLFGHLFGITITGCFTLLAVLFIWLGLDELGR